MGVCSACWTLFKPFIYDHDWVFANDRIRTLDASLPPDERAEFGWILDSLDWREYWMDVLYPGLNTWCMPILDGEDPPLDPVMTPRLELAMADLTATTEVKTG